MRIILLFGAIFIIGITGLIVVLTILTSRKRRENPVYSSGDIGRVPGYSMDPMEERLGRIEEKLGNIERRLNEKRTDA